MKTRIIRSALHDVLDSVCFAESLSTLSSLTEGSLLKGNLARTKEGGVSKGVCLPSTVCQATEINTDAVQGSHVTTSPWEMP